MELPYDASSQHRASRRVAVQATGVTSDTPKGGVLSAGLASQLPPSERHVRHARAAPCGALHSAGNWPRPLRMGRPLLHIRWLGAVPAPCIAHLMTPLMPLRGRGRRGHWSGVGLPTALLICAAAGGHGGRRRWSAAASSTIVVTRSPRPRYRSRT